MIGNWRNVSLKNSPPARSSHPLASVRDKIYLLGGEQKPRTPVDEENSILWEGTFISTDECEWNPIDLNSTIRISPLLASTLVALDDDTLVAFGGRREGKMVDSNDINSLYVFDLPTLQWREAVIQENTNERPRIRSYHCACALDGNFYIFGGCSGHDRLNDLWCFDFAKNKWCCLSEQNKTGAPVPRGGSAIVADPGSKSLYVIFGFCGKQLGDIWKFDLTTNIWTQQNLTGDIPTARSVHGACLIAPGKIFIFGGERETSSLGHLGAGDFLNDSFLYNCETGNCKQIGNSSDTLPLQRGWFSITSYVISNYIARIVLFGGLVSSNERMGDCWAMDIDLST